MMNRRSHTMKRKSTSYKVTFGIAFTLFVLYSLFIIFFFVFAFAIATKTDGNTFTIDKEYGRIFSFSKPLNFHNFVFAFHIWDDLGLSFSNMIWNSIWRTVGGVVLGQLSSALVCYVIIYYKNRLTKFIYNLGLFLTILPLYGGAGAQYKLYKTLGFINSPTILWPSIALYGGWFFYMCAFWKAISWEYAEAAFVDGANHFTVFFKIMFPMFLPSMMALVVISFITGWNGYEQTVLYMKKYPNLAYGIYYYSTVNSYANDGVPAYFAAVLIALIPSLVLFAAFQNTIMEKVHIGGLKG